jgi:hypothetical protein
MPHKYLTPAEIEKLFEPSPSVDLFMKWYVLEGERAFNTWRTCDECGTVATGSIDCTSVDCPLARRKAL